jgi:hypothetical protein
MNKNLIYSFLGVTITLYTFVLFGCISSQPAPEQKIVENAALQLANAQTQQYVTTEFSITNQFTKELNNETVFIYETVFRIKDIETGEVLGGEFTQTPDGIINSTFGLVKRGKKWYPMR